MKNGLNFLMQTPDKTISFVDRFAQVFKMIEYGNDKGYVSTWFTEHHFSDYGLTPNPLLLLAKASEVAPNLRIGSAVVVLPIWHPLRVAEDIAMLDTLTNGRFEFGIGRGYQPYEFNRYGVDLRKNREMFNESLEIVLGALTTPDFEYEGRFWTVPPTTIMPGCVQKPHPPIWMAATSPPTIRAAVERGYHLMTGTGSTVEELEQRNQYIDYLFQEMGRSPEGIERHATRFVFCSTNQQDIDDAIDVTIWQIRTATALNHGNHEVVAGRNLAEAKPYPGEPSREVWQQRLIFGNPDECIRRLQAHADAGITYVFALFDFGGLDHARSFESMKLFTREVMPAVPGIVSRATSRDVSQEGAEAYVATGANRYTGA
jgi:alkanesulfonate monooxygenase SsuD/methylene tetrahydromethanopterin reductase-like flavin-dependent oxidoreductase (luciferase family)